MRVESVDELVEALRHIALQTSALVERIIGRRMPISYLTIFAHMPEEYQKLVELAGTLGDSSETNNGLKFLLRESIKTSVGDITCFRIRKPDPYRSQLGCADFEVQDYDAFKSRELAMHMENLRLINRPEYEMLEFYDLAQNEVLAYVVSK